MMKKKDVIAQLIARHGHIFRCPVCGDAMKMETATLVCAKRHTFDLARRGYLNLLRRPARTRYDTTMLTARQTLCRSGFFTPLIDTLRDIIMQETTSHSHSTDVILDAGCGEGTHLRQLTDALQHSGSDRFQGLGLDISKDGIQLATRDSWDIIWCVANLSQLPIQEHCCDVVLNILSPANYDEFSRVLSKSGILIKVVPGTRHLEELRALMNAGDTHQPSSPKRVIQHFSTYCGLRATQHLTYPVTLKSEQVAQVLTMTPLSWNANAEQRERVFKIGFSEMTVDVHILIGRMSGS